MATVLRRSGAGNRRTPASPAGGCKPTDAAGQARGATHLTAETQ